MIRLSDSRKRLAESARRGNRIAGRAGIVELDAVEDVVNLRAKLQTHTLAEGEVLHQVYIGVVIARSGKYVPAQVSGTSEGLYGEGSDRRSELVARRSGRDGGISDQVGTIGESRIFRVARTINIERVTALERRQSGELPSAECTGR